MKLKVSELKQFASVTMHIKENGIMPILGYILWEGNTLTKTNLSAYAKHTISSNTEQPVLLEERVLYALANNTTYDEIEVIIGNSITLKTPNRELTHSIADITDFPKFPEMVDAVETELTQPVLSALGIAANFSDKKMTNFQYVYSSINDIFATDNFSMYFKQFDKVPELTLSREACKIMSRYESAMHSCNSNIDFFRTENTTFGFVQNHQKRAVYYNQVSGIDKTGGFKISKQDIIQFCNGVISLSRDVDNVCQIESNGASIVLSYRNQGSGKTDTMSIDIIHEPFASFIFDARVMLDVLSIPYNEIYIKRINGRAILHTDEDSAYMGFIAERI